MKETIAQEALRLLKPLDPDSFIIGDFSNSINKCCVIGHYIRLKSINIEDYSDLNCNDKFNSELRKVSREYLKSINMMDSIADINNSTSHHYPQETPYERVIACLEDMIKAGY